MNEFYQGLHFNRPIRTFPRRIIPIGVSLLCFVALWEFVPPSTVYWILLMLVGLLTWVASYGWRQALSAIDKVIHRLQEL